ncbi:MAG: hypothetical protein LH645_01250 [Actinomycetia bacterium]|nr:hypothetical protein [Actinomycetes bacterium]
MSPPTIVLHIGAMKTGTSYLQSVLEQNKSLLADRGVLWPGPSWKDQRLATQDLLASGRKETSDVKSWLPFADQLLSHSGERALVSMEFLSFAPADVVERAMKSLAPARVCVVLTTRDLGRAVPAQWQESMQNMHDWSYADYLDGIMSDEATDTKEGRHFWLRQDWATILRNWQPWVRPEDLVIVTLPASGGPSELLWSRFCDAVGLDPDGFDLEGFENDSLGAVSAELMHRVSCEARLRGFKPSEFMAFKRVLAKRVLAKRRKSEPAIVVPPELRVWWDDRSRLLIEEVRAVGPRVVGDLDDLQPRWPDRAAGSETWDMDSIDDSALLNAAVDGLFGMAATVAKRSRSGSAR